MTYDAQSDQNKALLAQVKIQKQIRAFENECVYDSIDHNVNILLSLEEEETGWSLF